MKFVKEFFKIFIAAILFVILVSGALIVMAWFGYGFGHVLQWGAGDILEGAFGIKTEQIPTILAWLFVVSLIFVRGVKREE